MSRPGDARLYPEIAFELEIVLEGGKNHKIDQSLKQIVEKMSNLEALVIELKPSFEGNFDYCLPVLKGLQSCNGLKELVLNYAANFASADLVLDGFFEVFIRNCPNITRYVNIQKICNYALLKLGNFFQNILSYATRQIPNFSQTFYYPPWTFFSTLKCWGIVKCVQKLGI